VSVKGCKNLSYHTGLCCGLSSVQSVSNVRVAVIGCKVKPYLPYEMTHEGMLLRLSAYIQHQDFCSPKPEIWPPLSSVKVLLSQPGQSCKDACWANSKLFLIAFISHRLLKYLLDAKFSLFSLRCFR